MTSMQQPQLQQNALNLSLLSSHELNPQILERIQGAANIMFSPGTQPPSQQQMAQANQTLNEFKSSMHSLLYAFELIQAKYDDIYRSYGFHILETYIKTNWIYMDQPLKFHIIDRIFNYIGSGTKNVQQEVPFVKEKIGVLFSEIAKREWPQRIPHLLQRVITAIDESMESCQISLVCIRTFLLDVSPEFSNDLDTGRKREIIKELQRILKSGLLDKFQELFLRIHSQYEKGQAEKNHDLFVLSKKLMTELLGVIQALMCDWCPLPAVFAKEFPMHICKYLLVDDFKQQAVQTLSSICHLRWREVDPKFMFAFILEYCRYTNEIMKNTARKEEAYEFNRSLCEIIDGIMNVNFNQVMNRKKNTKNKVMFSFNAQNSQAITEVVKIMVNFLEHPSLRFSEILISAWRQVFLPKSPIWKQPFFKQEAPRILDACYFKLHKQIGDPENIDEYPDQEVTSFSLLEWEDSESYRFSRDEIFQSMHSIIAGIVRADTETACNYIQHICGKLSTCCAPNPQTDKMDPETRSITFKSMTYLRWDAATRVVEFTVGAIRKSNDQELQVAVPKLLSTFSNVIRFEVQDSKILGRYLDILKNFYLLYEQNGEALSAALERIVRYIRFRMPHEANLQPLDLSYSTQSTRKKALLALIFICKHIPKKIIRFLDHMLRLAEQYWSNKEITGVELVLLYEALILVSNHLPDKRKKQEFLKYLLLTPKDEIVNEQVIQVCGNIEQMLKMFELIPEENKQNMEALKALYDKLKFALHLFVSAGDNIEKQSEGESEVGAMLFDILKPVHSLLRTIHNFRSSDVWEKLPAYSRHILSVGYLDHALASQLGIEKGDTSAAAAVNPSAPQISGDEQKKQERIRSNLHRIGTACYKIFGGVCRFSTKDNFYRNPSLTQLLTSSIFFNFSQLNSAELSQILKHFISPFAQNCPEDLVESMLIPMLITLYSELNTHLEREWAASIARKNGTMESKFTMTEEIVLDSMLLSLDVEVIHLPMQITKQLSNVSQNHNDPLYRSFTHSTRLMKIIFQMCVKILQVPDNTTRSKVVTYVLRLLPICAPNKEYEELLAGDITWALLHALTASKSGDRHNILHLLSDLFTWYKKMNSPYLVQVYQQLPHVTEPKWKQLLDNHKRCIKTKKGDQKFRKIFKEFLEPIIGMESKKMSVQLPKIGKISNGAPKKKQSGVGKGTLESVSNLFA